MKKFLLLTALTLLLSACGNTESKETVSSKPKEEPKQAEQKEVKNESKEPNKDETGKTVFEEAGQKGKVEGGTLELLKIKNVNETINISPLTVTVAEIKLFKMTEMDDQFKTEMEMYNDNTPIGDEMSYLQIRYNVENAEERNIEWNGLTNIVTDKGQQIDAILSDFIYTDADTQSAFLGKVKKEFADGFLIKDSDISKVKLIWGASMDADSYQDITAEQQVEYSF
ncbi:hypothetical protein P5G62_015355 [Neobacillus sp. 179-C4.2 HS]|uniref:DUF4352 domain-containing protein n=1 Tax=Neobacillus driksii TaxID=3035913 RepID=A0ABV4YUG6_9BACI|nr:hypothetical protein [Neobacillus sp. 179.-C4.2 HS]MDP5192738.1 hypothetical protein [Neobacillus sp. 179.-C4.2 HS]